MDNLFALFMFAILSNVLAIQGVSNVLALNVADFDVPR